MRIANVNGRLALLVGEGSVDVESASGGQFAADVQSVYDRWSEFADWADAYDSVEVSPLDPATLGPPVPRPPQVFAIGVNYKDHAEETGMALPETPMVFTKFPAAINGPYGAIAVPPGRVDWEVELVAVVGRRAERIAAEDGWAHIAGLTVGQDISERDLQMKSSTPPQFNLGKSYAGFAPIGPVLVTPDELAHPEDVGIACALNGETMQRSRTSDMVFTIPQLVAYLSGILPLLPGDLIFTGTPGGIGARQKPPRFLGPDDVLTTTIEGIGEMRHTFFARV